MSLFKKKKLKHHRLDYEIKDNNKLNTHTVIINDILALYGVFQLCNFYFKLNILPII